VCYFGPAESKLGRVVVRVTSCAVYVFWYRKGTYCDYEALGYGAGIKALPLLVLDSVVITRPRNATLRQFALW
jgi:hypothetical protein